jgi:hypothetical protein
MKASELLGLEEIAYATLPKSSAWTGYNKGPAWLRHQLMPVRFKGYMVLMESFPNVKNFVIVDQKRFKTPAKMKKNRIEGVDQDIPKDAIVGGVTLGVRKGGPTGESWAVNYLAFNPDYQGQGLPIRFYKWLLDNHQHTGIGSIKAGSTQTPGSQKLWANLSKMLLVFAYDPKSDRVSQVDIGPDGRLEANFDVYPDSETDINKAYEKDMKLLMKQLRADEIDRATYQRQYYELLKQRNQEVKSARSAKNIELYAVLPTRSNRGK